MRRPSRGGASEMSDYPHQLEGEYEGLGGNATRELPRLKSGIHRNKVTY